MFLICTVLLNCDPTSQLYLAASVKTTAQNIYCKSERSVQDPGIEPGPVPVRDSRVAGQKGTMPAAHRHEASMAAAVSEGLCFSSAGSARPWYSKPKASPAEIQLSQ